MALLVLWYTLLLLLPVSYCYQKMGCFPESAISGASSQGSYLYQSSGYCEGQCSGDYVIALTGGDQCYCGSNLDQSAEVDSSYCSLSCTGYPADNCGGDNYFLVYIDESVTPSDNSISSSSSSLSSTESSTSTSTESSSSSSDSVSSMATSVSSITSATSSSSTLSTATITSDLIATSSTIETSTTDIPSTTETSTSTSSSSTSTSSTLSSTTSTTSTTESSTTSPTPTSTSTSSSTEVSSTSVSELRITQIISSVYVSTSTGQSDQVLMTIIHSVTSVSIQTKTATAVLTATIAPSNTNASLADQNKASRSGISGGAIAGIVVGVVCGVVIFGLLLLWYCGIGLLCIAGRRRTNDYDDEKSIRDDSMSIHRATHLEHDADIPGLPGFGRTAAYTYNADELSIGYGNRRFSQGSLPDAAGGSESDTSNKGRGLRVINPD